MLAAHIGEKLRSRSGSAGPHVLITAFNSFDCFFEILALPFQVSGQSGIERASGILSVPLGVLFQLGPALGIERYHVHG